MNFLQRMTVAAELGQTKSWLQLLPGTADALLLTWRRILSPFFPLPTLQKRAEMREILKQGVMRLLRHVGMQSKFSARRKWILIILKALRFFFSCLGCSRVISMTTGQQPSFLKADNQSCGCLSAHQPPHKNVRTHWLVANKWIKEVEASKIIKFPGVCEHQWLQTQISFPTERDAGGTQLLRAVLGSSQSSRQCRQPRCAGSTRAAPDQQEPLLPLASEKMSHRTWKRNGRRGYSNEWVRDEATGNPASLVLLLVEQGVFNNDSWKFGYFLQASKVLVVGRILCIAAP